MNKTEKAVVLAAMKFAEACDDPWRRNVSAEMAALLQACARHAKATKKGK